MKRSQTAAFLLVLALVFIQPRSSESQTETTPPPRYNREEARALLLNPKGLEEIYEKISMGTLEGEEESACTIAKGLLLYFKGEDAFLRKIVELYVHIEDPGFIATHAINLMDDKDNPYFKHLFERTGINNEHTVRTEALRKIQDLEYVKQEILREAAYDEGAANPGCNFLLWRGEELYADDPVFVDYLADFSKDQFVREAAIGATSNRAILNKYANLSDVESDQHSGVHQTDEERLSAFYKRMYRNAAREKLAKYQ
jgi:hypothetical protein